MPVSQGNTGSGIDLVTSDKAGVQFFFNMPASQLVQSKSGEITGVIAKGKDGNAGNAG
jgi:hypothetical protein